LNKKLLTLLLLTAPCFAFSSHGRNHQHRQWPILSAAQARADLESKTYEERKEAIDWWIDFINAKIEEQCQEGNATVAIDIDKANHEVQNYLQRAFEREGYRSEFLITVEGHYLQNKVHHHYYLGLSW